MNEDAVANEKKHVYEIAYNTFTTYTSSFRQAGRQAGGMGTTKMCSLPPTHFTYNRNGSYTFTYCFCSLSLSFSLVISTNFDSYNSRIVQPNCVCVYGTHYNVYLIPSFLWLVAAAAAIRFNSVLSMPLVIIQHVIHFHISIHKCSKNTSNHKNVIEYIFHILSRVEMAGIGLD